ncbi:MAG: flavodoxin domain-containing protein, partial [Candidatus Bathyarchaeia archaeon]
MWKTADDGVVGVKALVVYYSETGNTEKVAQAIAEEASRSHQVHLKKVSEVTAGSLTNYDLVFLGSACHNADLATPAKG